MCPRFRFVGWRMVKVRLCKKTRLAVFFGSQRHFYFCQAILAAVVVVALKGLLLQFSRLVQLWRICKPDAVSEVPYLACNSVFIIAFYTVVCI